MSKALLWIGGIFFAFGLVFGGVGASFYFSDMDLVSNGSVAEGKVISLASSYNSDSGTTYRPVVEFHDSNGTRHQFTGSIGSSPAAYSRGEIVDVIYDPADPSDVLIDSFSDRYLFPLVFGGFGSVFGLIGGGMLLYVIRRKRTIRDLKATGLAIDAKFIDCFRDTSVKINGRSPFRVTAQATHPATGKLTSFDSEHIWLDLTEVLHGRNVRVLVDLEDPDDHYIDLSEWVSEDEMA